MTEVIIKIIGKSLNALSVITPRMAANKALNLFATPRKGKLTDAHIPALQSAYTEELTYDNMSISTYRWIGKNKTVLLAHGWESNASRWHYLIKILKNDGYNIIALDAPAHGNSDSHQFNAILYAEFINIVAQKYKPEILIGHSAGGMALMFFQAKYQLDTVKKIVILGAPAHFTGVFSRYADLMGYNTIIRNKMNVIVKERFGQLPEYFSAAQFSKDILAETLIVHDESDKIIPYDDALLYHDSLPNSELLTTQGLGHSLVDATLNEPILNFIKRQ